MIANRKVALVACVSKKLSTPRPAKDLYISDLFLKASKYAVQNADEWYILSAKYGLLDPNQIINPYNETLNTMPAAERRNWARKVLSTLKSKLNRGDRVIFLAGQRYRENLIEQIMMMGCLVEVPMEGLRIGEQMQWLNQRIRRI